MFTGLIEDVGKISRWRAEPEGGALTFESALPGREIALGDSIAVNGCCLTVVKKAARRLTVDVSPETLKRTNLSDLAEGGRVNLERPLQLNDRLGGHMVTGHVDAVGQITRVEPSGDFTSFRFSVPAAVGRLLVPKGSIAVDGISLTVNECTSRSFSVAIIPFTLAHTNLQDRGVGDRVNLEADIIGKYVQQFVKAYRTPPRAPENR
ncbi:MAG: riboflavin synthase [Deltaproteobacteria bacterium]|nr:riboflavin synthase [Deltaproteobacteria bacterium]